MKRYSYAKAKRLIQDICQRAVNPAPDTRDQFIAILEQHPDVAAIGFNPFGKVFYWNAAATRLFGHTERTAFNKDIFHLIHPPGLRELAQAMVSAARRTFKLPAPGPCDLLRRNGEPIAVYCGHFVFQWEDSSSPEFYCVALDIHHEHE